MKTLHVIVSNKVATYLQRDGYIVCGNSDYQVEFTFSSEWDAYERKTARFIWGGKPVDVEFSGNVCPVPIVANTEQLKVGVYVENLSTTTSAVIPCKLSVLCDSKTEAEGKVVIPDGTPVLGEATITENGEHYPGEGYDGFYKVTVKVAKGGEIPEGYIKPTGTKPITENGTHDVTEYASVAVNVPTGSGEDIPDHTQSDFTLQLANTASGELGVVYSSTEKVAFEAAPSGKVIDTFVDTNFVPGNIKKDVEIFGVTGEYEGEGGATPTQEKSVNITENGKTEVLPDEGFALSKVTINANVKQNYCLVRFYNDDRTTLLYEVLVPYGSSAIYAGNAPTSSLGEDYAFTGFEPSTASVTADTDCYAVYEETAAEIGTLGNTNWATISSISEAGTAANYFAVGDSKAIALKGKVGVLDLDTTLCAYIIGLNHNGGTGITFGTFKTADTNGVEIALAATESGYPNAKDGTKIFNFNHWGDFNYGGWKGSDLRYDILGSTDKAPSGYGSAKTTTTVGYDASTTCATNPVANTLMAALPVDLRVVMKPMTIYTDNTGNKSNIEANVTASIDYLPLLAEYEVFGVRYSANQYEQNKQAQYAYYASVNSLYKYRHSSTSSVVGWSLRSPAIMSASGHCTVTAGGSNGTTTANTTYGLSPIFKV